MKVKRTIVGAMILSAGILMLAGCGKSGANQANEKKVSFIKDAQSSNQRIWYMAESDNLSDYELSKNSHIQQILVTKNGKATVYNMREDAVTMRSIDGKSDKKVIMMAKDQDKQYYKDSIKKSKQELKDRIDSDKGVLKANKWDYSAKVKKEKRDLEYDIAAEQSFLEKFPIPKYKKPTAKPLKAKVFTDNSGNDVVQENIIHKRISIEDNTTDLNLRYSQNGRISYPQSTRLTMTNGFRLIYDSPVKILNTMYVGYTNPTNRQNTTFLMTKTTNKDSKSAFDTLKTKNVTEAKD